MHPARRRRGKSSDSHNLNPSGSSSCSCHSFISLIFPSSSVLAHSIRKSGAQNSAITCLHTPHGVHRSDPCRSAGAPTMAIALKYFRQSCSAPMPCLRSPSLIAFTKAVRSAHIDGPNAAFSTLQPVYTLPSAHSNAAPTRKREYGAYDNCRAVSARRTSASSSNIIIGGSV